MVEDLNKRCDRCEAAQIVCDAKMVPYEWVTMMNGFESHLSTVTSEIDLRFYGCSTPMINWVEEVLEAG